MKQLTRQAWLWAAVGLVVESSSKRSQVVPSEPAMSGSNVGTFPVDGRYRMWCYFVVPSDA